MNSNMFQAHPLMGLKCSGHKFNVNGDQVPSEGIFAGLYGGDPFILTETGCLQKVLYSSLKFTEVGDAQISLLRVGRNTL